MIKIFRGNRIISEDTRQFRRLRSFSLIRYNLMAEDSQKSVLANPRDISAGGMSFVSDREFPKGHILEMEIYLPPLEDFITVIASIISNLKIKDTNQYLVRVRFKAIDPEERKRINSYIEGLSHQVFMRRYLDKKAARFTRLAQ